MVLTSDQAVIAISKAKSPLWPRDYTILPHPDDGMEVLVATMSDAGRNANGVIVGQKIGRDIYKLNNLTWKHLEAAEWHAILSLFEPNYFVTVRFPDPLRVGRFVTRRMYPGDRTAQPRFRYDENGKVEALFYKGCKVNLIDTGE